MFVGTLRRHDSFAKFGTLDFLDSFPIHATFRNVDSFGDIGTLPEDDSFRIYETISCRVIHSALMIRSLSMIHSRV